MDLQNNKIKFGVLLKDERAKTLLERAFPMWANTPLLRLAENMPLSKVIKIASRHVDAEKLSMVLNELEKL